MWRKICSCVPPDERGLPLVSVVHPAALGRADDAGRRCPQRL
ncbi:MAG: hypothetical protein N2045_01440 [Fimbriimonadales bacterium]|nr:hypothetical protein [Fimbriimonadales bacterium]GIV12614.1 MAG: hypothetical protein KatS3mg021_0896 [Fimbriimonadales bacterium]